MRIVTPHALLLVVLGAALSILATASVAIAQSSTARPTQQRLTIEPYAGPPIFLDEREQIAAPRIVERKTLRDEKYADTDQVRVERDVVLYSDDHFEADGAYREFYPNGKLFVEGTFNDGRQHGEWTYYYDNGEVNRKAVYKDGQPDGAWDVYRADGTLAAKREYVAGQRNGQWVIYDASGEQPVREEHYDKGKQDGVWKTWFPDGQLKQEASFRDGVKHGPSKEWTEKGELRADVTYVDGKIDGTVIVMMPDGRKVVQEYDAGRMISERQE